MTSNPKQLLCWWNLLSEVAVSKYGHLCHICRRLSWKIKNSTGIQKVEWLGEFFGKLSIIISSERLLFPFELFPISSSLGEARALLGQNSYTVSCSIWVIKVSILGSLTYLVSEHKTILYRCRSMQLPYIPVTAFSQTDLFFQPART